MIIFQKWNIEFDKIYTFLKNSYLFKKIFLNNKIYWGNFKYLKKYVTK